MVSRIEAVEKRIVMRNDLFKAQRARIGSHMSIGDQHDVIA